MMTVYYFGSIAEVTKSTSERLDVTTLQELLEYLKTHYLLSIKNVQVAINHNVVNKAIPITFTPTDEIAVLSAFSGG